MSFVESLRLERSKGYWARRTRVRRRKAAVPQKPEKRLRIGTVPLLDLKKDMCHFPFGEGAGILFCGEPVVPGKPYCEECARIVYQPSAPLRPRTPHYRGR